MNKFTKAAIATTAILLGSAASAVAAPVMTLTLTSSANSSAQCLGAITIGTASYAGTTCTVTDTTGDLVYFGAVGDFNIEQAAGLGNGSSPLSLPQPSLWLDNNSRSSVVGASMVVGLGVQGYDSPSSPFPLLSTLSGTNGNGMRQTISAFFDSADTGVIGAGTLLMSASFEDFFSIADLVKTDVSYSGTYGLSWILTVERIDSVANGVASSTGINGSFAQALPGPAAVGMFGLGLIGLGMVRRRKTA